MATSARPVRLVLVPALITLVITVVRLVGERSGWSPRFFSTAPGGGNALIGIVWLIPVFGVWFGARLARADRGPEAPGRALLLHVLAVAVLLGAFMFVIPGLPFDTSTREGLTGQILSMGGASVFGALLALFAWPLLFGTNLLYAFLARLPVAVITWFAVHGAWGTHYEKFGPKDFTGFTPAEAAGWLVFAQLVFWTSFTVVFGGLCGAVAALVIGKRRAP